MNDVIANLLTLQEIQFGSRKSTQSEIETLRKTVPEPILGHYDRLIARGKKGVAVVKNGTCTGCYMRLASGTLQILMRRADIQLCDTCGRYLYLSETAEAAPTEPAPKKAAAKRKKKVAANAA
jgi:predicted  nucleic acid-binding Zn-ribbon protein